VEEAEEGEQRIADAKRIVINGERASGVTVYLKAS
jgi:hypothetical protein